MTIRPQLKHLGIYVDDIERMERFYTEVFGLTVTDRGTVARLGNRKIIFMSAAPDAHHQMVLIGTEPINAIDHGNAWSVYAPDPEGNGLEAYLDSPWHVAQPHGRPLDLCLSDEEIHRHAESVVRKDPTFRMRDAWMAEMAGRLS